MELLFLNIFIPNSIYNNPSYNFQPPPPPNFISTLPLFHSIDTEMKTLEAVEISLDSQSFRSFRKPDIWFCGNQTPSFYSYLKWFESLFQSRSKILSKAQQYHFRITTVSLIL